MTKAPKTPDSRAKALAGMTKAELIKTIKSLDKRQTALLNQVARLTAAVEMHSIPEYEAGSRSGVVVKAEPRMPRSVADVGDPAFPWETK